MKIGEAIELLKSFPVEAELEYIAFELKKPYNFKGALVGFSNGKLPPKLRGKSEGFNRTGRNRDNGGRL